MWQKCWNQNTAMLQGVRYRERGPMKSWRPETMAEAIWAVLQEGLSLSQAARKHDIPYPTFVLYANRVHNMLGPSLSNGSHSNVGGNMSLGEYLSSHLFVYILQIYIRLFLFKISSSFSPFSAELRPKGRGRPQRILLGNWPDEHVRQVIRAVVFRDGTVPSYTHAPPLGGGGGPLLPHHHAQQPRSLSPPNGRPFSSGPSFGTSSASPPHPPPPTPSSTTSQAHSPPIVQKFAENNLFASHLKQLSDHFAKNGGGHGQNGQQIGQLPIFESLQFKALMNEAMIQQPHFRRSMDFEDADEPPLSRRGSLTPPLRPLDLEMPRLIPNSGGNGGRKSSNNQATADIDQGEISDCEDQSQRSHSNENIIEDPMNLVETSWEVSSLNEEPPPTASCSNNKMMFPQTAGVIKN